MSDWYYAEKDQRVGPVPIERVRELLASATMSRSALVWTEGMPAWSPAGQVPALSSDGAADGTGDGTAAAQAAPVSASPGAGPTAVVPARAIGYYAPDAGLPARAAATLRGHALPTGDVGDWPLDDPRVSQFADTLKIRKQVTGAASLYRSLFGLSLIVAVPVLIVSALSMAGGPRSRSQGWEMMLFGGALLPFAALYYFTFRATMRAQRWAPLTMLILFLALVAVNLLAVFLGAAAGTFAAVLPGCFGIILPVAFAIISLRSFVAIPRYLAQPAWCQELIVKAGL